jgi:hypothetical protein
MALTWDIRRLAARLGQFIAAGPSVQGDRPMPGAQQAP